jgi:hypothetical protein
MRSWIFNRIKALDLPAGMAERIISSGSADNPLKPFIVLSMGIEEPFPGMPASTGAMWVPFDVWVHDRPGSMVNIDDAARMIKDALPVPLGAVVGGVSVYECQWTGTGQDAYDDHYNTNTRDVSFRITARR